MDRLTIDTRKQVLASLVEGNSIRATVRMTGAAKNTVTKLLVDVGQACLDYQDGVLRNLPCKRMQVDEIWAFCYAKEKNVPGDRKGQFGYGDVWTWTAICADTKLIPSWMVGYRTLEHAKIFFNDLAARLANRVQLTTDGHKAHLEAVEDAFGADIDYAKLIKIYGPDPKQEGETRYSPGKCNGADRTRVQGNLDPKYVSTSYVERQNLNMRMSMRRFTRLTNAFSKKVDNLQHALALHFMNYNFVRIHQTLRVTPAMEAGVTDTLWTLEDVAALAD